MTQPQPLNIEDLKVGDRVPADAMLAGPFSFPVFTETGCEWVTINADLPVAALADD